MSQEKKFNPWPTGIILAFVLFAALIVSSVVIGINQELNLVTEDYYEKCVKFLIYGKSKLM